MDATDNKRKVDDAELLVDSALDTRDNTKKQKPTSDLAGNGQQKPGMGVNAVETELANKTVPLPGTPAASITSTKAVTQSPSVACPGDGDGADAPVDEPLHEDPMEKLKRSTFSYYYGDDGYSVAASQDDLCLGSFSDKTHGIKTEKFDCK